MKMKIVCPYCDNSFTVKRGSRTQNVYCKKCYSMFVIPPRPIIEIVAITMMVAAAFSMFIATYTAGKSELMQQSSWSRVGRNMARNGNRTHIDLRYIPPVDESKTDFRAHKFETIDTIYTDAVKVGKLRPGQVRPADIGKTVIWRGLLVEYGFVGPTDVVYAKFQHKPGLKGNVIVYLNENHYQWLGQLKPGAYVTYSGVLNVAGYDNSEHVLLSGSIISMDQF